MKTISRILGLTILALNATHAARADDYLSAVLPGSPVVGDAISIRFACQVEPSNLDDVDDEKTRVRMEAGTIRVDYYRRPSGTLNSDFCFTYARVGPLPVGTYPVKIYAHFLADPTDTPSLVHETQFTVRDIEPLGGEARPEQNFSGVYWASDRSGESLTIAQSPRNNTLGMLINAFSAEGLPFWMYFVSDRWVTPNRAEGRVFSVTGPSYFSAYPMGWPGASVSQIGTGTIEISGGSNIASGVYELTLGNQRVRRFFWTFEY